MYVTLLLEERAIYLLACASFTVLSACYAGDCFIIWCYTDYSLPWLNSSFSVAYARCVWELLVIRTCGLFLHLCFVTS